MEMHIGQLIRERLDKSGMKKSEFARRINKTSQNVYDIFERKSIDTGLLRQISEVLEFNFFETLSLEFAVEEELDLDLRETALQYSSTGELIRAVHKKERELNMCSVEINQLKKEVEYLKQINELLQKKRK
jgi:transcriptional regulator with XRE-family HTH domain